MEICNKIQNELQIGHEKLCPWPENPCPPSFLSLPPYTSAQWKSDVRNAFDGLVELRSNLPELNENEIASMVRFYCVEILFIGLLLWKSHCHIRMIYSNLNQCLHTSGILTLKGN